MDSQRVYDGFLKLDVVETPDGRREVVRATDSVSILFFDATNDRVLLVRQPRAPMISEEDPEGMITECVAGRFDKALGVKALVVQEASEEAGVTITEDEVELLNNGQPMAVSAGVLTERSYLCFAELRPGKVEQEEREFGAKSEGERITRVWVPVAELASIVFEDVRVFALVQWFLLTQSATAVAKG